MLEIKDPSVAKIDPYQTDKNDRCSLTRDQAARVINECKNNFWYFCREVVRLKGNGGPPVKYKANRGNMAQSWCLLHGIDSYLVLPRQQGKTMTAIVLITWALLFGTTNSNFIFISLNSTKTKDNLNRVKDVVDLLPEYMRHEYIITDDGKVEKAIRNATTMKDPVTKNTIMALGGPSSEEKALNLARGESASILYFDEPEFIKYFPIVVANTYPAFSTSAANAKANNSVYGRIFTTTPGDLGTTTGKSALKFVNSTVEWTDRMYDWGENKIREYIKAQGERTEGGNNGVIYIKYHYWQLGKTREWADEMLRGVGNDITAFRREVLLQRMSGSDDFPYNKEDLSIIESHQGKVIDELFLLEYFRFKIYRKLNRETPYLVGVDCSTGTNKDNNAITIVNPRDLKVDAEFSCAYIGETEYENILKELCKVIPKAVLIIERNSVGDGIIDHLLNSPIRKNLYFDKYKDLVEEKIRDSQSIESMLKKKAATKTYYGIYTSVNTRKQMFAILAKRVMENKEDFVGENVIRDLGSLVKKGDKIEAGPGAHDDSIMSYLMAMHVYYHGNNLFYFGITQASAATDDELDNSGIYSGDDTILYTLDETTQDVIKTMREKEKFTESVLNFDKTLEEAIVKSQQETSKLIQRGYLQPSSYDIENPQLHSDFSSDSMGSIDMDFFDEVNNIF